jgi:hypothetical protein
VTTKKLTRSKRKELRVKGQLKPVPRLDEARKAAERQAEEEAAGARVHEAREQIAQREDGDDDAPAAKRRRRPDLTLLLLAGVIVLAGIIFYLSQRGPAASTEPRPAASADATKKAP